MTSRNPFARSSDMNDTLDDTLNAYVRGDTALPVGQESTDAIAFHYWAEGIRRTDPAASGPAAGTWNHVLRNTAQGIGRGTPMRSAALTPTYGVSAPAADRQPSRNHISRYLNIAASVAILAAMALGGWFALGQLPPGEGGGRFAALQATPDIAQTCDVEPLTVDEVMAIVENPLSVVDHSWWGTPVPGSTSVDSSEARDQPLLEVPAAGITAWPDLTGSFIGGVPSQQEFEDVRTIADQYLACAASGTWGQVWRFSEPATLQQEILAGFPVYRSQDEIREFVEKRINEQTPRDGTWVYASGHTYQANPTLGHSRVVRSESLELLDYDTAVIVGMEITDDNGNLVAVNDWSATTIEGNDSQSNGTSLILVRSASTGTWYVLGHHAPRG